MRAVGAVVTGIFAGLLAGVLLADVVAGALGPGATPSERPGWALLIGVAPGLLAVVGGVVGFVVEARLPPGEGPDGSAVDRSGSAAPGDDRDEDGGRDRPAR